MAPEKLLHERLTLHKYVNHFKGKEAARPILDDLNKDLAATIKSPDLDFAAKTRHAESTLGIFKGNGMESQIKSTLAAMGGQVGKDKANPLSTLDDMSSLVKMHTTYDDGSGVKPLIEQMQTRLHEGRQANDANSWRWQAASLGTVRSFMDNGLTETGTAIFNEMLTDNRSSEKKAGDTDRSTIAQKSELARIAADKFPETHKQLLSEFEKTYERMRGDIKGAPAGITDIQTVLRDHYMSTKDKDKLSQVIGDLVTRVEDETAKEGHKYGALGTLTMHGEIYAKLGMNDKAIPMYEKAYAMANESKNAREANSAGRELARLYAKMGRVEDSQRISQEIKEKYGRRSTVIIDD